MEENIKIVITSIDEEVSNGQKRVRFYERKVYQNGEFIYSDKIDAKKFLYNKDPLTELYCWLNNRGHYRGNVRKTRKNSFKRCLVAFFQVFGLHFQLFALRLKYFYLQKKLFFIKLFHFTF